jgi:hypothetical protein|tara:strand:- start:268 stop:549 length:282 start_codon:yes stop_codon:yes gene_type:complete
MYTVTNYKTKKALKEDVAAWQADQELLGLPAGTVGAVFSLRTKRCPAVTVFQPGGFFPAKTDGRVSLEGPHYPEPHRWYAQATLKDGIVVAVK